VLGLPEFLCGVDADIGLVIDLPAPAIVVERPYRHDLSVEDVGLSVQDLLVRLVHLEPLFDQSAQQQSVLDVLVDWLVALRAGDEFYVDSSFKS